ncbi:DNA repair protein RecN [Thiohalobacter sp.]|uniref:DNA repair protein RecN n=1 Tax=Thiohalobacter sp. TaxID=2025948 RepID=UPI002617AC10|nr:DNA repair protein RecN [Thiohalobacter sp.]
MLGHIHLRDFVLVDDLELELGTGMTALTGETGAGKSILVDALGLALGDRADSGVVRHGAERAEISVGFSLDGKPGIQAWLEAQDLADEGECLVRRVIPRDGRARAYINGRPVTLAQLRELGERLVDIHGQHEHQSLLRREVQRALLDRHGGHAERVQAVADTWRELRDCRARLEALRAAARDRAGRLELLRFHVEELRALGAEVGELARLQEEHRRLANRGRLQEATRAALHHIYEGEPSAHGLLGQALRPLEEAARLDPALGEIAELVNGALIQAREAADMLAHHADAEDEDPERLAWLDARIASLQQQARKHHVDADALPEVLAGYETELDQLDHADAHLERLEAELAELDARYREQAAALTRARRKAAGALGKAVTEAMQGLGMEGGRFEIAVTPAESPEPTRHGPDQIEFRVSANPGQPFAPLSRVASGGELSRISLAIQVIAADAGTTPVLVFDEVDTGIGGGVAEVVGRRLRELGERVQVLCVTHLPQVAVQAHHQIQVSKLSGKDQTRTRIRTLSGEERVEEVARMLGGVEVTESTLNHAREMLERAGGPSRPRRNKKRK